METVISTYGYFLMMKFSKRMREAIYQESKGKLLLFLYINRHISTYIDCFNNII